MKEPAKFGLFTLEEEDLEESKRLSWSSTSARSTSTSTSFSPSGSEDEIATPSYERADPFDMPMDVDVDEDIDIEVHTPIDASHSYTFQQPTPTLAASLSNPSFRPRRPPPLNLSLVTDSFALSTEYTPTDVEHHHHLLPPLPILSPEEYSACSATSRRLDLDAVFQDLMQSCGELESFPMPPPRPLSPATPTLQTPTTPPSRHYLQCPGAPGPKGRTTPKLKGLGLGMGDHSFLYSLSSDGSLSTSSRSSPSVSTRSKGKSLPRRSDLPSHWTDNII